MQHLLECCGRCDQVVLKDTLVQDADERVCDSCVPSTAFSLPAEDLAFLDELIDCELPLAHDWNNQCPPPSARAMGEHLVIPEEIWAFTQNLLMDIKKVLRNDRLETYSMMNKQEIIKSLESIIEALKAEEQEELTTFDFGNGPVPAHRHKKPDGSIGGWVADTATVADTAYIGENAQVYGNVEVYGNAQVYGNAEVYGYACVSGNAEVYGNARVYGNAEVYGDACVSGDACVYGNAEVYGNARVYGNAEVYGIARVYGNTELSSGARNA